MATPDSALFTVEGGDDPPTLAQAAAKLGVAEADLNAAFGVVPIDPARKLYAVEVRMSGLSKLPSAEAPGASPDYSGPYSNPQIAPFGPVQSGPDDGDD